MKRWPLDAMRVERIHDDLKLPIVSHNKAEVDRLATRIVPIHR
jgi:ABC-type molybdate transport system ATPase subunit